MNNTGLKGMADAVGRGFVAGLLGTAAMTLSSTIEMKLRGRTASKTPAEAICRTLGLETISDEAQQRLNNLVHWGYGTTLGAARGLLGATGLNGLPATVIFFGLVWATEHTMLPKVGAAPSITEQPPEEVAIDAWHHFVYAQATGSFYDALFVRGQNRD